MPGWGFLSSKVTCSIEQVGALSEKLGKSHQMLRAEPMKRVPLVLVGAKPGLSLLVETVPTGAHSCPTIQPVGADNQGPEADGAERTALRSREIGLRRVLLALYTADPRLYPHHPI